MTREDLPAIVPWDEQPATAEEIAAAQAPLTDDERAAIRDLVRWFTRRYPTFLERHDYIRRKWREAQMLRKAGVR